MAWKREVHHNKMLQLDKSGKIITPFLDHNLSKGALFFILNC